MALVILVGIAAIAWHLGITWLMWFIIGWIGLSLVVALLGLLAKAIAQ